MARQGRQNPKSTRTRDRVLPRKTRLPKALAEAFDRPEVRAAFKEWGAEGGKKGAKARWGRVSPEERRAHAQRAARARWSRRKKNA
jgi:hypothetical protein